MKWKRMGYGFYWGSAKAVGILQVWRIWKVKRYRDNRVLWIGLGTTTMWHYTLRDAKAAAEKAMGVR